MLGIDLGSRNVKIAVLKKNNSPLVLNYNTIEFYRQRGSTQEGRLVLDLGGIPGLGQVMPEEIVSTGYGRQAVNIKGARVIPEIKAHVLGAAYLTGLRDFTLLDLGGQDSKVALVKNARVVDFMTNDKCAASTGRYLENMALVLNLDMNALSSYHENPVELSSTCAIFGETELIGRMVEGHSAESLAAGVNYTIYRRIKPMLLRLGSDSLVFTGGVSRSPALLEILRRELGVQVIVPELAPYAGALGCCVEAAGGLDSLPPFQPAADEG